MTNIVRQRRAEKAQVDNAEGNLNLKRLVQLSMAKPQRANYLASIAVRDEATNELNVHSSPTSVARYLVKHFYKWMGVFWYDSTDLDADTEAGRKLRRDIALHGADAVDFPISNIPKKIAPVLDALKMIVPGSNSNDYDGLLDPLTFDEWKQYWPSRPSGKAPGMSGITCDMMKACPESLQRSILLLMNTAFRTRYVFKRWKKNDSFFLYLKSPVMLQLKKQDQLHYLMCLVKLIGQFFFHALSPLSKVVTYLILANLALGQVAVLKNLWLSL